MKEELHNFQGPLVPLIECQRIKKYFPGKGGWPRGKAAPVKAVDGVDFSVRSGENVGLVGESGCGKTTLARLLLRLVSLDEGLIFFEGEEVTSMEPRWFRPFRRNMQIVFQDPYSSLDPRWTVRRILAEGLTLDPQRLRSSGERTDFFRQCLKDVRLPEDALDRHPHEFSGGERQRIALARALVLSPKLLILDEAVSSLDVKMQCEILDLLDRLKNKYQLTYLFISHNLKVVKRLCPYIAVMFKGKIVERAPADQMFNNPQHLYTKELLSAAVAYKVTPRVEEIVIAPDARWEERGPRHFVLE